jgi:hypothetical protein
MNPTTYQLILLDEKKVQINDAVTGLGTAMIASINERDVLIIRSDDLRLQGDQLRSIGELFDVGAILIVPPTVKFLRLEPVE